MRSVSALSLALFVLFGCASAPKIDYYTLGMERSGEAQPEVNLVVERLQTTEALSRSQILIHTSATEIEYYAADHWAGGLGELVQRKLAAEFGPPVESRRNLVVSGTVLACEQADLPAGTEARITLQLAIRDATSRRYQPPLLDKTYACERGADRATPAAVVESLSLCVEELAAEIAADAAAL